MEEQKDSSTKTETASAAAPKKSNVATIVIIVVVVILILGLGGCLTSYYLVKKAADTVGNGKVNIGGVEVDSNKNQVWPTEIPNSIPKFTAGKIDATAKIGDVWTITVTGVKESDFENYKNELKKNGWTIESEVNVGGLMSFSAKNSDGWNVNPMFSVNDDGTKSMLIGISLVKSN